MSEWIRADMEDGDTVFPVTFAWRLKLHIEGFMLTSPLPPDRNSLDWWPAGVYCQQTLWSPSSTPLYHQHVSDEKMQGSWWKLVNCLIHIIPKIYMYVIKRLRCCMHHLWKDVRLMVTDTIMGSACSEGFPSTLPPISVRKLQNICCDLVQHESNWLDLTKFNPTAFCIVSFSRVRRTPEVLRTTLLLTSAYFVTSRLNWSVVWVSHYYSPQTCLQR